MTLIGEMRNLTIGGNTYSIPVNEITPATSSALGGIKIGYTTANKNYAVLLDSDSKAYINVPWTDTKQNVTLATTSKAYLTGVTTTPTSTAQALAGVADTGVYLTAIAGEISAVRHSFNVSGTEKAYMVFNSTTNAIDFIFN